MTGRTTTSLALTVFTLLASGAAAVATDDRSKRTERTEQTVIKPREFTIPKGQCSQIAADIEVKGLGVERTTTVVESAGQGDRHDGRSGGLLYSFSTKITGTATDNFGGTYTFAYQFHFTKPAPLPGSGIVVDRFELTGTGAANGLSTFFRARATFDSASNFVGGEILEQSGQPFGCDPL